MNGSFYNCSKASDFWIEVQISHGRVAAKSMAGNVGREYVTEVIVFDFDSGEELFRCAKDLNFPTKNPGLLLLQKEQILFAAEGKIYRATF